MVSILRNALKCLCFTLKLCKVPPHCTCMGMAIFVYKIRPVPEVTAHTVCCHCHHVACLDCFFFMHSGIAVPATGTVARCLPFSGCFAQSSFALAHARQVCLAVQRTGPGPILMTFCGSRKVTEEEWVPWPDKCTTSSTPFRSQFCACYVVCRHVTTATPAKLAVHFVHLSHGRHCAVTDASSALQGACH